MLFRQISCVVRENFLPLHLSDVEKFDATGQAWPTTNSDLPLEVAFFVAPSSLATLARVRSAIFRIRSRSVRPGNASRAWAPSSAPSLLHVASRSSLASLARVASLRSAPRGLVAWSPRQHGQVCPIFLSVHATAPSVSGHNHPSTLSGASPTCRPKLARFARSRALGHIPHPVAVGSPGQRFASLGALVRSLPAPCGLAELARFARSRALATLASSRCGRLVSVSARASLPMLPLRPCHHTECFRLQPPRHPYGSLVLPPDA